LSLANNNWIGDIPAVLAKLTLPEQLLIAHYHPHVFVFKLYPKSGRGNPSHLQRAMKGTVSTYAQDVAGVSSMLEGNLMPRPPSILATLITIAFIGKGKLPRNYLRSTFRVRRFVVHDALQWMKSSENHHYETINISSESLSMLPEDDIPFEIECLIRQSEDEAAVRQEEAGYVVSENGKFIICG
ncbi:hypothetical protein F5880DRAFT_1490164, partial [Lentinula raphanica]